MHSSVRLNWHLTTGLAKLWLVTSEELDNWFGPSGKYKSNPFFTLRVKSVVVLLEERKKLILVQKYFDCFRCDNQRGGRGSEAKNGLGTVQLVWPPAHVKSNQTHSNRSNYSLFRNYQVLRVWILIDFDQFLIFSLFSLISVKTCPQMTFQVSESLTSTHSGLFAFPIIEQVSTDHQLRIFLK